MFARFGFLVLATLLLSALCVTARSEAPPATKPVVRIQVGDLIDVAIQDLIGIGVVTTKTTRVMNDGSITLPLVGHVKLADLTLAEAEQAVADAYHDAKLIDKAQVSIQFNDPTSRPATP